MTKFFMINAMVADSELHDVMSLLEQRRSYQINARPVPVEASAAIVALSGDGDLRAQVPRRLDSIEAPKPAKRTKPKGRRDGSRSSPEYKAMQEATRKFFETQTDEFTTAEFAAALRQHGEIEDNHVYHRLSYYIIQGVVEKLSVGRFRVIRKEPQP